MVATILTAIGVIVAIITLLVTYKWERPELTIEFRGNGGHSSPMGHSNKNVPGADGFYDGNNAILIIEMLYNLQIVIRNNSELTAYYPKIYLKETQPPFYRIDTLNEQVPI